MAFGASTSWNESVRWQKPDVSNKTGAFGDVCWLYRIVYKVHARFDDETASFSASTSTNLSIRRPDTVSSNKTGALGNVCWVFRIVYTKQHMQDLVMKQRRLVHLHQQTRALGDQTLLFLTRLVRLVMFAEYTRSCNNYMQLRFCDETAAGNYTGSCIYKPHVRYGDETVAFGASTSWSESIRWQKTAVS